MMGRIARVCAPFIKPISNDLAMERDYNITPENAREMQERSAQKKRQKKAAREALLEMLDEVVEEVLTRTDDINDFGKRTKKKRTSHAARIFFTTLSNPKTAYDAMQDVLDRVLGKPKQVEHQRVDLTTGGKAFTGFSSVLPVVPNIEEICAEIDAKREAQNKDDDE